MESARSTSRTRSRLPTRRETTLRRRTEERHAELQKARHRGQEISRPLTERPSSIVSEAQGRAQTEHDRILANARPRSSSRAVVPSSKLANRMGELVLDVVER